MRNSTIQMAENIRDAFNAIKPGGKKPGEHRQVAYDLAMAVLEDAQGGSAGTHAYDMLADYSKIDLDNLESLINLTAATVLSTSEPSATELQVTFSPKDMDELIRNYEVTSDRKGLLTTIVIKRRPGSEGIMEHGTAEEAAKAQPQAKVKVRDRPIWAIRYFTSQNRPRLARMNGRGDAERQLAVYRNEKRPDSTIENRMCLHPGCPSDRCIQK